MRARLELVAAAARAPAARRRLRCASACESSQSASHGLRGSSGPWRYVPTARPSAAALEAALAVVAEAGDDAAERLGAGVEPRAAGVVLEARERAALARLELALEQHVADHPPLAGDRLERQQADAGHVLAVEAAVAAAEQLVAAAHGEQRGAAVDAPPPSAAPPSRRGSPRRAAARGPGRRRRSRGRARPGRRVVHAERASRRARGRASAARRASTAMLPRSA